LKAVIKLSGAAQLPQGGITELVEGIVEDFPGKSVFTKACVCSTFSMG